MRTAIQGSIEEAAKKDPVFAAKTARGIKSGTVVRFKRRGKVLTGKVVARWAKGEGDGYGIETNDGQDYDVHTKNIVG